MNNMLQFLAYGQVNYPQINENSRLKTVDLVPN